MGVRVQGLGFMVQDAGFRVQGAGCRAQGSGSRAQGPGSRVQDLGFADAHDPGVEAWHLAPCVKHITLLLATLCAGVQYAGFGVNG
jgi:hypothetical protein